MFDSTRIAHLTMGIPASLWRPGQIVAYTGILGAGKTALMTLVCNAARSRGRRIISNYDAQESGFIRAQNMFDIFDSVDCVVCLDEIQHVGVDSRDSLRGATKGVDPRVILYWFDLVRKDDVSVHYTTQSIDKADKRIRELTGWILHSTETDIPHVSKVQIMRYGGQDEASQVGAFVWDKRCIYGAYNTKDKKVKLFLNPDGVPLSPFPSRESLLSDASARSPPPSARGVAAPRGGRKGRSVSDDLIEFNEE